MLVANQDSDALVALRLDPDSGRPVEQVRAEVCPGKINGGEWGFKHENIYYFDSSGAVMEL